MVEALELAEGYENEDEARERIQESVLSVEVRSGWYPLQTSTPDKVPVEYRILLTTGGPACQLVGELDEHGEPESARLEHQDWGTPWTKVHDADLCKAGSMEPDQVDQTLLTFAHQFYFGEG